MSTRQQEKLLCFFHHGREVLAHYDCVTCDLCNKAISGKGLKLDKNGEKYHDDCKSSRDPIRMKELDAEIEKMQEELPRKFNDKAFLLQFQDVFRQRYGDHVDILRDIAI